MTPEAEAAHQPHPTLSQPWGDPDYDPSCPDCREGRHGRLAEAAHREPEPPTPEQERADYERRDALLDALYDDGCLRVPQTDHIGHVIAALAKSGYRIEREAAHRDSPQLGLDWLAIFDRAANGDGNGTHGQDRFGFNARVDRQLALYVAGLRATSEPR